MAIVAKKKETQLSPALKDHARAATMLQVKSNYYAEAYKEMKSTFFGLLERDPDVVVETGSSVHYEQGLVRWQSRANYEVNSEAIAQAIEDGKLTVLSLLACVSKFKNEAISALVPDALSAKDPTEFGVMQATSEFKKDVIAQLEQDEAAIVGLRANGAAKKGRKKVAA